MITYFEEIYEARQYLQDADIPVSFEVANFISDPEATDIFIENYIPAGILVANVSLICRVRTCYGTLQEQFHDAQ